MKWEDILKTDFSRLDNIALANLHRHLKRHMLSKEDLKFIEEVENEMKQRGMGI